MPTALRDSSSRRKSGWRVSRAGRVHRAIPLLYTLLISYRLATLQLAPLTSAHGKATSNHFSRKLKCKHDIIFFYGLEMITITRKRDVQGNIHIIYIYVKVKQKIYKAKEKAYVHDHHFGDSPNSSLAPPPAPPSAPPSHVTKDFCWMKASVGTATSDSPRVCGGGAGAGRSRVCPISRHATKRSSVQLARPDSTLNRMVFFLQLNLMLCRDNNSEVTRLNVQESSSI